MQQSFPFLFMTRESRTFTPLFLFCHFTLRHRCLHHPMIFHCMHLNFQRLIFAGKLFPIAGYFSDQAADKSAEGVIRIRGKLHLQRI